MRLREIEAFDPDIMLLNARTDNADAGIDSGRQSGRVLSLAMVRALCCSLQTLQLVRLGAKLARPDFVAVFGICLG